MKITVTVSYICWFGILNTEYFKKHIYTAICSSEWTADNGDQVNKPVCDAGVSSSKNSMMPFTRAAITLDTHTHTWHTMSASWKRRRAQCVLGLETPTDDTRHHLYFSTCTRHCPVRCKGFWRHHSGPELCTKILQRSLMADWLSLEQQMLSKMWPLKLTSTHHDTSKALSLHSG